MVSLEPNKLLDQFKGQGEEVLGLKILNALFDKEGQVLIPTLSRNFLKFSEIMMGDKIIGDSLSGARRYHYYKGEQIHIKME